MLVIVSLVRGGFARTKKFAIVWLVLLMLLSVLQPIAVVKADTRSLTVESVSEGQIQKDLDYYTSLNEQGIISDYDLVSIQMMLQSINAYGGMIAFRSYYPERHVSHLNYQAVKYLYEQGIAKAKFGEAVASAILGSLPGVPAPIGWGLSTIGLVTAYGGYSSLEQAVHQAYWQRKGIDVYYKIHKSIMSLNTVRYVVR